MDPTRKREGFISRGALAHGFRRCSNKPDASALRLMEFSYRIMPHSLVQSLWIGGKLSTMEQLCIESFLQNGHPFHLYAYDEIDGVPSGVVLKDGREILPADQIFSYRRGYGKGNPSAFSNLFRYKLLLEKGGWWSDVDAVCLRPLDFPEDRVVGDEREPDGTMHVAVGLLKLPAGCPLAEYCWDSCRQVDKKSLRWGQIGPRLFAEAIERVPVSVRRLEANAFYPFDYWNVQALIANHALPPDSYSVHLWNSQWKKARLDPDGVYDPQSVYERLKQRYLSAGSLLPQPSGDGSRRGESHRLQPSHGLRPAIRGLRKLLRL